MSNSVFTNHPSSASFRWLRFLVLSLVLVVGSLSVAVAVGEDKKAAEHEQVTEAKDTHAEHHEEEKLTAHAMPLFWGIGGDKEAKKVGAFALTNSMIVTWLVAIGLIIFAQVATRNIKEVPEGIQNFWEWLVESLHNFLESIIGHDLVKKTFWFFATLFIFILFTNWAGLIPGVGTIGWGIPNAQGGLDHISTPLFRGVNADLNMTLAMAMVFFVCWTWWAISANGFGGFVMHLFGPKGHTQGFMKAMMIVVFILAGFLEVVSILFRPVSLSFRLYGNVFAGENMLESMSKLVPGLSWLIPLPFYFLELLVGIVQALVFMLLTAVFTLLICQHEEEHH